MRPIKILTSTLMVMLAVLSCRCDPDEQDDNLPKKSLVENTKISDTLRTR
ncbi:hypothetical protein PGH12_07175 [Chryseobacterium wangxinyae]|nr:hypothetical protein [Chryseobacterium sp. CY350]MCY0976932.1 hypothetical protein [Chryseobacterium sp. CY350]WBZ96932.1 hypothetical protein PGH12_07175 [Chryseobacterium sp. CY350]